MPLHTPDPRIPPQAGGQQRPGTTLWTALRRMPASLLVGLACALSVQMAHAKTEYCTSSSVSYSPALTSTMYYSAAFLSGTPVVVYQGTAYWTIGGCSSNLNFQDTLTFQTGPVMGIAGLTVEGTGVAGTTSTTSCTNGSSRTMASSNTYSGLNILPSSGSCTYQFPFRIVTNSTVGTTTASVTAAQLVQSPSNTAGWLAANLSNFPDSQSTTRLSARGSAITFRPRSCTLTYPSQTVTLPAISLSQLTPTNLYSPWFNWTVQIKSCANMQTTTTASVTFTYTELTRTGYNIVDNSGTASFIGVQIGYNGSVLVNGVAQSLGTFSSGTSADYNYTLQARYARFPGPSTNATSGTVQASASYMVTYN